MNALPRVSVLMPCYNAAGTLAEALETLASQTLPDFEIIAVDDGSTDSTRGILENWAGRDPRMSVLVRPHRGIIPALNDGLAACRAPLVVRMDADDRCHPLRLERQVAWMDEHPPVAAAGCLVKGFPETEVRLGFRIYLEWLNSLVTDEQIRREIFVESPLAHPSVIFRKDWVERAGQYQDHGWPEDYDLWLRLYLQGARFGKVAEVLVEWREAPQRLTRCDSRYSVENFLRAKAHYLQRGPLSGSDAVFIWGAGMMGRRLGKQLQRVEAPLVAFFDIDPRKIGSTRRGLPILPPAELLPWLARYHHPVVLAAVGARGARQIVRQRLNGFGLLEGQDWWSVA